MFVEPAFYVKKKFMGRLREDGDSFVIRVDEIERDFLLQAEPDIYTITDHYVGYPYILVRLSKANVDGLGRLLEAAWRQLAPKRGSSKPMIILNNPLPRTWKRCIKPLSACRDCRPDAARESAHH